MPITQYSFEVSSKTLYKLLAYKELVSKELKSKGTMYMKLANKGSESKELMSKKTIWKPAKPANKGLESKVFMSEETKWKPAKPANKESEYSELRSTLPVRIGNPRETKRYGDNMPGEFLLERIYQMYKKSEKVDENAVVNLSSRALRVLSGFVKNMSHEEFLQCLLATKLKEIIPGEVKWHTEELNILRGIVTIAHKTGVFGQYFIQEPGEVLFVDGNAYVNSRPLMEVVKEKATRRKVAASRCAMESAAAAAAAKVAAAKEAAVKEAVAKVIAAEVALAPGLVAADHTEPVAEEEAAKEPVAEAADDAETYDAAVVDKVSSDEESYIAEEVTKAVPVDQAADDEELAAAADDARPPANAADDAVLVVEAVGVAEKYDAAANDEGSSDEASHDEELSDEGSSEEVTRAASFSASAAKVVSSPALVSAKPVSPGLADKAVAIVATDDAVSVDQATDDEGLAAAVDDAESSDIAADDAVPVAQALVDTETYDAAVVKESSVTVGATPPPLKEAAKMVIHPVLAFARLAASMSPAKAAIAPAADDAEPVGEELIAVDDSESEGSDSDNAEEITKVEPPPASASAKLVAPVPAAKAAETSKWSIIWGGVFSAVMVLGFLAVVLGLNLTLVGLSVVAGVPLIVGGGLICGISLLLGMKTFDVLEGIDRKEAEPQKPPVVFAERATPPVAIFEKKHKDATSEKKAILLSSLGKSLFFKQAQDQAQPISRNESCYGVMRF